MSLVGFDHAFAGVTSIEFAPTVHFNVAPLAVIALLKIVAHLDDPYRRAKDLIDLKQLMSRYEARGDRVFCDEVFAAELEDIDQASAFLLGLDIGLFATRQERDIMHTFIDRYRDDELIVDDANYRQEARFQRQLRALKKGLGQ
jgi:predicted nucleotidyltransferase